ncbi:MAG: class I SAM-dependent methyltransferase [Candidatus Promineifilaceae bacterium]
MGSATIQGELWSSIAQDWADCVEPHHVQMFKAVLAAAKVGEGTRLLDAGCGAGGLCVMAVEWGADVSGLDAAEKLLEIARKRVPGADFRLGDLEDLPFDDDYFDVSASCNAVFFASDPVQALRELRRVTKPDGYVVVSTWGKAEKNDLRHIFKAAGQFAPAPPKGPGPFGLAEPGVTEGLLAQAGLQAVEDGWVDVPYQFEDEETLWQTFKASSDAVMLLRNVPENKVRPVIMEAARPFQNGNGSGRIERQLRYVLAKAA